MSRSTLLLPGFLLSTLHPEHPLKFTSALWDFPNVRLLLYSYTATQVLLLPKPLLLFLLSRFAFLVWVYLKTQHFLEKLNSSQWAK